jgi:mannosyl-oligosaccharide alpha-1,3-glucosidase
MHFPQMVVIVDPHLKRVDDYPVYKQAKELDILVKQKNGKDDYEGWCWPGSSSWVDFFNPASWDFWKSLFRTKKGYFSKWSWTESTEDIHIWNDMNEVRSMSNVPSPAVVVTVSTPPSLPSSVALRLLCLKT